jgi:lysophospholipase L1-like esterase
MKRQLSAALLGCAIACSPANDDDSNDSNGTVATGGAATGGAAGGGTPTGGSAPTGGAPSGGSGTGGGIASGGAPTGGATAAGGATQSTGGASGGSGGVAAGGSDTGGSGAGTGATNGSGGDTSPPELTPVTVYLAGDSTVSTYADTASTKDQAGWGQMLHERFGDLVTVDNRAIGGRTARRFIDEGALNAIWEDIAPGDYLFVQFGTNDGNKTATYTHDGQTIPYYLDPNTDFKTYLMQYVDGARQRNATPVLVTPPPRNSAYCTGGNGTGGHAQAMRDLGAAEDVTVLDLNARTVAHLKAICPAPTPEDFFLLRGDGTVDGTHFQENGARFLASFVALELGASDLPLAAHLD